MRMTCFGAAFWIGLLAIGVAACEGGTQTTSTGGGGTTSSTTTSDGTGASGAGGTGQAGGTSSQGGGGGTTTTSDTPTGPTYGFCAKPCTVVKDCCAAGAPDCPSDMYPNNHECKMGACFPPQCSSTADCTALNPDLDCLALSGTNQCGNACTGDMDCASPLTCSGVDDNGKKYCKTDAGGCTNDASCSGFGKCIDKVCVCEVDADCTFQGFTKCAL